LDRYKFDEFLECKTLKIFHNVKTQWIFVLFPIKSFLTSTIWWYKCLKNKMLLPRQTWLKLIELFMAIVLKDNEDKRCLFVLTFIKNNFKNIFTTHLDLVVCMYAQKIYTLKIFTFAIVIKAWTTNKV